MAKKKAKTVLGIDKIEVLGHTIRVVETNDTDENPLIDVATTI